MTALRITVSHPGRQHSHQLAISLAEAGILCKYYSGVPINSRSISWLSRRIVGKYTEKYAMELDPNLAVWIPIAPITRRVVSAFASRAGIIDWSHRADAWFDRVVARRIARDKPDAVICYENAALRTFQAAKQSGIKTILDAASLHHATQDQYCDFAESSKVHDRIVRRKDAEIDLADVIITASDFARESYVRAGIPSNCVYAVPVGVDIETFVPKQPSPCNDELRIVFVGNASKIKGFDLLTTAFQDLQRANVNCSLSLFGVSSDEPVLSSVAGVKAYGRVGHNDLAELLSGYDVLVLPSRFDSFGMVVAEAMASGVPVIVSENVGSKQMVVSKNNGIIFKTCDADALFDALHWFAVNRAQIPEMRLAARKTAELNSWAIYRRRVVCAITDSLGTEFGFRIGTAAEDADQRHD